MKAGKIQNLINANVQVM